MVNFNSELNLEIKDSMKSTRDGYGEALIELGESNSNVVVLTADLPDSTRTKEFKEKFPERFFDVGVAEQNLAGVSAGLALSGKIPFMSSFGAFSPGRNWDQIRVSICYSKANVKIASTHTGLGVGEDGATHQILEDIALTRVIPNMIVINPADAMEAKRAIIESSKINGPVYIRLSRQGVKEYTSVSTPFEIGKAYKYIEGSDVTLLSSGVTLQLAIDAVIELGKQGIRVELINVPTIKPLDTETILTSVKKTNCVVTLEDHQIMGGFGSAIAEFLSMNYPTPIEMVGVNDTFGESGPWEELYRKYGLSVENVIEKVKKVISRKQ